MSREIIEAGKTALGIEFGSTRIKAVLTSMKGEVLGVGFHDWENSLVDGVWTYPLEEIHAGLRSCYSSLRENIEKEYGITIKKVGALGISAMMHGYLAFDEEDNLLAPFQTWRNSNTGEASKRLTDAFDFNIPLRWTISHLYQRILDGEKHVEKLAFVTTLDSYIHYLLSGEKVSGIGDASGIFPIDSETMDYDEKMVQKFDELISCYRDGSSGLSIGWKLRDVLPKVLVAGERAGVLTLEGAALLDESGNLQGGAPMCPPEGDAGTGMVATNAIAPRTGNVSAGTSTFAMLVLDKKMSRHYPEIDMVTTPTGYPVAMSHANNGTSDLNSWVNLFAEFAALMGNQGGGNKTQEKSGLVDTSKVDMGEVFSKLYVNSLNGDKDCGGLLSYGYLSGEGITKLNEGRPMYVRTPNSNMNLANFMRAHLYTSLGAVKMGMDIMLKDEGMKCERLTGHGGFFKTKGVGQRYLAAAVNAPVTVMETASEGGPWGMAILAIFLLEKEKDGKVTLDKFLDEKIFANMVGSTMEPDPEEVIGFERFMENYKKGIEIEKKAVEVLKD